MKHVVLVCAAALLAAALLAPDSTTAATRAASGQQVFAASCAQCHAANTTATQIGPGLMGLYKRKKMPATGKPVSDANVRAQIVNGGGGMPAFGGTLSAADINAVIAYLKTL